MVRNTADFKTSGQAEYNYSDVPERAGVEFALDVLREAEQLEGEERDERLAAGVAQLAGSGALSHQSLRKILEEGVSDAIAGMDWQDELAGEAGEVLYGTPSDNVIAAFREMGQINDDTSTKERNAMLGRAQHYLARSTDSDSQMEHREHSIDAMLHDYARKGNDADLKYFCREQEEQLSPQLESLDRFVADLQAQYPGGVPPVTEEDFWGNSNDWPSSSDPKAFEKTEAQHIMEVHRHLQAVRDTAIREGLAPARESDGYYEFLSQLHVDYDSRSAENSTEMEQVIDFIDKYPDVIQAVQQNHQDKMQRAADKINGR